MSILLFKEDNMKENILELITQALTENWIFDIIQKNEEYQKAKEEEHKAYNLLVSDLTVEQRQRLDDFIGCTTWSIVVREKVAYQQGMKDFLSLIKSLL